MSSGYVHLARDGRPCMCSICICGRHSCPGVYKCAPLGGSSHYRDTFTPKKGDREASNRERAAPINIKAPPGHFQTTYQVATNPAVIAPSERVAPYKPKATTLASAPFDGKTTQRTDFAGHMPNPPPRPPIQHALPKVPGTYDTTLGAMQNPVLAAIKAGSVQRAQTAARSAKPMPHLPFDSDSSYKAHYPPKHGESVKTFSPRSAEVGVRENRDFGTTKSLSYPPPPLPLRPVCPASLAPIRPASRDGHIKVLEPISCS